MLRLRNGFGRAKRIVHRLWMEGAVQLALHPSRPVGQVSAVNPRRAWSSQPLKAANNGETIRNLLDYGRPQGVIGMWLWEGRGNAIALWQAKRRAKDMSRRNQAQPPEDASLRYLSDRITERLTELYWQWRNWYRSNSRGW